MVLQCESSREDDKDLTGPESVAANSRRSLGAVPAAASLVQTCGRCPLSAEARQALSWKRLAPRLVGTGDQQRLREVAGWQAAASATGERWGVSFLLLRCFMEAAYDQEGSGPEPTQRGPWAAAWL